MKNEFERLQFITRNYALLQGYPIGLVGLLYILLGAAEMIWRRNAAILIYGWLGPVILAIFFLAVLGAQRHYRQRYGVVKAPMESRRATWLTVFIVIYFVLIQLGGANLKHLQVPLEPTVFNGGLILVLGGLLPGFPWRHYLVIGLPLMAVAFLPAFHLVTVEQFAPGWGSIAEGMAFLLCGSIDRLIFTRNLVSLKSQESHA